MEEGVEMKNVPLLSLIIGFLLMVGAVLLLCYPSVMKFVFAGLAVLTGLSFITVFILSLKKTKRK